MRFLILPSLFLLTGAPALAQDLHADGTKGAMLPPPMLSQGSSQSNSLGRPVPSHATATPGLLPGAYLFPYWTRGRIQPLVGQPSWHLLKYNSVDRQLIERTVVKNTEVDKVVNTDNLYEFTVGDSAQGLRLTYRRYLDARVPVPALRTAFFEVHYDVGKSALLCQRISTPGREDVLRYYLKTADNVINPITLGPKPVLAALGATHADDLARFASQQRLNLHREADVTRLLAYHDSL